MKVKPEPKTKVKSKKKATQKHAEAVLKKQLKSVGWNTSDEDEINRRYLRGVQEKFKIVNTETEQGYFSTFKVYSESGSVYEVEIRSLPEDNRINSCNCPDYEVNGLGICKHIAGVLEHLKSKGKRKFEKLSLEGSPRTEIYLKQQESPEIKISWSHSITTSLKNKLSSFFSSNGSLLAEPFFAIPALERELLRLPASERKSVRLSNHISVWVEKQKRIYHRNLQKEQYIKDIKDGKRSLDFLKLPLYEYQKAGMIHLAFNERALLADEMGLGKTVQAIAASELLRRTQDIKKVLIVAPTSLKSEWEEQIDKFTDLPIQLIIGNRAERLKLYQKDSFFYIANYEQIRIDYDEIQKILNPDLIILDEAQRVKNWKTQTATSVKRLHSPYTFVLTGTPLENKIDEIFSIMQVIDPEILGPLFRFNRNFYELDSDGKAIGVKNLDKLHKKLLSVMLRRKKSDVEGELPKRTINNYFVKMEEEQMVRYEEYSMQVARLLMLARRRPLRKEEMEKLQKFLACMRMLCDTTYILDKTLRISPKLIELESILEEISEDKENKIIIFSEWEKMLELIKELAEKMGIGYAWHTGSVHQTKRRSEINRFKKEPGCRIFLSTDSGSVGLNLQNANYVINMDLPWNPAKLEQRIARAWRKHQTRSVNVINLITENSIESRMIQTLAIKQSLAEGVLDGEGSDSIRLRSEGSEFLDRITKITGVTIQEESVEVQPSLLAIPKDPLKDFRDDIASKIVDKIEKIDVYTNQEGKQVIFSVVDKKDPNVESVFKNALDVSFTQEAQTPAVELVDKAFYAQLMRLSELGVISINSDFSSLIQNQFFETKQKEQKKKLIEKASTLFSTAERKHKIASTLSEGNFFSEAIPFASEALEQVLKAVAFMLGDEAMAEQEKVPFHYIEKELLQEGIASKDILLTIVHLRDNAQENKEDKNTNHIIDAISKFIEWVGIRLNQEAMVG